MEWRTMESAPRDGTKVLLAVRNQTVDGMRRDLTVGWYSSMPHMWVHGASEGPDFWMPLPEPPPERIIPPEEWVKVPSAG